MSLFKSFVDNYWEPPPKVKVAEKNDEEPEDKEPEFPDLDKALADIYSHIARLHEAQAEVWKAMHDFNSDDSWEQDGE